MSPATRHLFCSMPAVLLPGLLLAMARLLGFVGFTVGFGILFDLLLVDFPLSTHSLVGFTAHPFFLNGPPNFPLHTFWVDRSFRDSLCNPHPGSYCSVMEVLPV